MPFMSYVLAALVVANILTFGLWRYEASLVSKMKLRGQVAQEQANAKIKAQKQITEDTVHGWKAALDVTRQSYAGRLRVSGGNQMPGLPTGSGRITNPAQDDVPAPARVAEDCAEETVKLLFLQEWAKRQERAQ